MQVPQKLQKGIYITYKDIIENKPKDDTSYYLKSRDDMYYLVNMATGKKEESYYAIVMAKMYV